MDNQKILSILIPAFNYKFGIFRILKNLEKLSMDFKSKFEVIIFDDSEKNILNANEIINFQDNGLNLLYKKNDKKKGACYNWNSLLKISTCNYKWLLHHDEYPIDVNSQFEEIFKVIDTYNPKVIILPIIVKKKIFMNVFAIIRVNPLYKAVSKIYRVLLNFIKYPELLFTLNIFGPPSVFIVSKDMDYKFDSRFKMIIDIAAYYRLLKNCNLNEILFLNSKKCILESEVFKDSITSNLKSEIDIKLLEKEEKKVFCLENNIEKKSRFFEFLVSNMYRLYKILTLKINF